MARGDVGRDAGHAGGAAVAAGQAEPQRHVRAPADDLLEQLGPARLHGLALVGAEALAVPGGEQVLAGPADDLTARAPGDALELGVDNGEPALAVLRVEDQGRMFERGVEQRSGLLELSLVPIATEPSSANGSKWLHCASVRSR